MNLNKLKKIDTTTIGILVGLATPIIVFMLLFLFKYQGQYTFMEFTGVLFQIRMFTKIISLCAIPNLLFFFLFLRVEYYYAARGIIVSTFLVTFAVLIIKLI